MHVFRTIAAAAFMLGGYQPIPAARDAALATGAKVSATPLAPGPVVLISPLQLVTMQRRSGAFERAWFEAQLVVRAASNTGAAQMDGAILVVSAVDGPMPQLGRGVQSIRIEIEDGSIDSELVIRFTGTATLDRERETSFRISGSARLVDGDPDYIVWDIVGGNVWDGAVFESEGWLNTG